MEDFRTIKALYAENMQKFESDDIDSQII